MDQPSGNRFRILAVDDESSALEVYRRILTSIETAPDAIDFDFNSCSQGDQAVEMVQDAIRSEAPYAVIFLDLNMPPGPDGAWTAEEIQKLDPIVNIVLVTGFMSTDYGGKAHQTEFPGRVFYLQKPFHRQEIVQFATALSLKWLSDRKLRSLQTDLEVRIAKRTVELEQSNRQLRCEIAEKEKVQQRLNDSLKTLKKVMDGTIEAIAMTVDKRDPYTSGHQQRVAQLAKAIAEALHLAPDRIEGLVMAATLHDIGKIAVPAEILSKPSRLTDIEIQLVQSHAQAGYDILSGIDFPWPIDRIVLQHHERLDGSGYPNRLAGDEIMLEARILGVSDVVETMASHRPYRPSVGTHQALEEISQHRNVLYDRRVVDACLSLFYEKGYTFAI
jgi:response regulator RpfG family c-di-GMP phosphodiesterase